MAVATESRDQTAAIVGAFRGHVELRTTALGTWYLAQGAGRPTVGVLVLGGQCDIDGLASLTWRLKQLDLPGIVPICDLLTGSGQHWLIISSTPGPTLTDLVKAGRQDPDSAVAVVRDTGSTLLELHRRGLVHGNIGASSVIVDDQGAARLLDWFGGRSAHTAADDVRQWARLVWSLACGWCAQDFTLGVGLARAAGAAIGTGGLPAALDELNRLVPEPPRAWLAESSLHWLSARCAEADADAPTDRLPTAGGVAMSEHVPLVQSVLGEQGLPSPRRRASTGEEVEAATGTEPSPSAMRSLLVAPPGQTDSASEHLAGQSGDPDEPGPDWPDPAVGVGEPGPDSPVELGPDEPSVEVPSGTPESSEYRLRWRDDQDLARLAARATLGAYRRERRRRSLRWAVIAAAVIASVSAAMLTFGGPSSMHVRSISVQLEPTGTACAVLGTVITNGLPGTLAYRWTDGSTQPALLQTATMSAGQYSVRLSAPNMSARPAGTVVALELLQPDPRRAFVELGTDCY
jgi:hypothetical protein